MKAVQRHILSPSSSYQLDQALFPTRAELIGGNRLHDEAGRSAMQWPSRSLDLGVLALATKSASSHTVEGVPGRVQELNGTSWADRGHGGSSQLGVTGRTGVPDRSGVIGGLLVADLLSDLFVSFFLEGREELSGRLLGRDGVTFGDIAFDSATSSNVETTTLEPPVWATISECGVATPISSITLSIFGEGACSSHCFDLAFSSSSPQLRSFPSGGDGSSKFSLHGFLET